MNKNNNYQWTTSIFDSTGREFTTGYFSIKQLAIDDLLREKTSGFILLDNPESEGDIQDIEFIKITEAEKGKAAVSEVIFFDEAIHLYLRGTRNLLFRKVIVPSADENMKIKLLSYLIHNVNDSDFLLHREIGKDEVEHQKNENTFQYGGKTFLPLRNCSSEEEAIGFIHLYWNEIKQLNKFEK